MVDINSIKWQKFRDNAHIKELTKEKIKIDIIKLKPNSQFDAHIHKNTEWIYVLKGSFRDEEGTYSRGHFITAEKGSKHTTKSGNKGCEVLVVKLL